MEITGKVGRRRQAATLYVSMNGHPVGELLQTSNARLEFTYSEEWLKSELCRPISLSMPLSPAKFSGDLVYNYFDNLLPDNQNIRNRIQSKFGAKTNRCFDLLKFIGRDCVGALRLTPTKELEDVKTTTAKPVSNTEIGNLLRNYQNAPLGMLENEDFRISIAGAQEKTALLLLNNKWHKPIGATPTSHILKLPIGRIEHSGIDLSASVENEWLCHLILKEYGIPVANTQMANFGGVKVLVVERFDRRWVKDHSWLMRLPQEDMCQALKTPPGLKYESDGGPGMKDIMSLLIGSKNVSQDRRHFLTVQLIYWLLAAIDGHAKNFSIFIEQGGGFRLTPVYDVLSAHPIVAKKQLESKKIKMAMAVIGKNKHYRWSEITKQHWLDTATACRFPVDETKEIIRLLLEQMDGVLSRVEALLPANFPTEIAMPIFSGMRAERERLK